MRSPSFFPWRLFRWFVGNQFLLILILFSVYYLAEWARIDSLADGEIKAEQLDLMRRSLGVGLLLVFGVTVLMGRRLVTPMGRLIEKTRRLRKFPFATEEPSEEELGLEETGEWYDLERAINKLGRDFRSKTVRLSREKTELRAIMTAIGEAVLAVDVTGAPLFYNSQFADMFRLQGWDERKMGLGEIVRSPEILEHLRKTLAIGDACVHELEISLPGRKAPHSFRVTYTPLRKKHNSEVYGVVAVFFDQSNVKAAEKLRIEFVANASHELRTPVTPLKGYIQTLKEDLAEGRTNDLGQYVDVIERNVNRLSDLLDDLLDLSRLEAG
ncbi:MAG: hypothetical protein KDD43_08885, partial [Bdellovibrionales bacterium]|nr:hypothetical protein [Bdellovibrionales bacterium]